MSAFLLFLSFSCGIEPIPPIQCSSGTPVCVCEQADNGSTECHWEWQNC